MRKCVLLVPMQFFSHRITGPINLQIYLGLWGANIQKHSNDVKIEERRIAVEECQLPTGNNWIPLNQTYVIL